MNYIDENEFKRRVFDLGAESDRVEFLGDEILYELCLKYPRHDIKSQIYAKVWLIGRAYAVALERGKTTDTVVNDFFYQDVVSKIQSSDIDKVFDKLRSTNCKTDDILKVYIELIKLTKTFNRGTKHSFCSKYLHFHFPELFFIYDSRAVSNISKIKLDISKYMNNSIETRDLPYLKFYYKCLALQELIQEKFNIHLTPRQIDTFLLKDENEKLQNNFILNK